MAHNDKKTEKKKPAGPMAALSIKIKKLEAAFEVALKRIDAIENPALKKSIHKIEEHAGEKEVNQRAGRLSMQHPEVMLQSAINASKILPPNLLNKKGHHTAENLQAICGFEITEEIYKAIYPEDDEKDE